MLHTLLLYWTFIPLEENVLQKNNILNTNKNVIKLYLLFIVSIFTPQACANTSIDH